MNNNKANIENELRTANALKAVFRLGHEAFSKKDLHAVMAHILNNTPAVLKYDRASIINCKDKKLKLLAVSGQDKVNQNSEYTLELLEFMKDFTHLEAVTELNDDFINENCKGNAFKYFQTKNIKIIIIPLLKPGGETNDEKFFWVVEFYNSIPGSGMQLLQLLSMHYREALWYFSIDRENILSKLFYKRKHFTPKRILIYLAVLLFIISFVRVSQNVVADFELVPYDEVTEYAPYSGMIENVNFKNGQWVKKGDTIFQYNTEELTYNLSEAKTQYDEISAELDWIKQQSFSDKRQLGRVKILALQQAAKKIEIEKNQWYLDKADIKAETSGTLVLNESEKWQGKAVRAGDELFEIVPPKKINAEVMLNESDASVLNNNKANITLYLHSRPETPITGKVLSISPKPMLTKTGQFAYIIKMNLSKIRPGFIVGMRGIARVSGEKVSIGYYLFKNLVLWWRKV